MICIILSCLLFIKIILNLFFPNNPLAKLFALGMCMPKNYNIVRLRNFDIFASCLGILLFLLFYFTHSLLILAVGAVIIVTILILARFFYLT